MPIWKFRTGGGAGTWAYQGEIQLAVSPESGLKFILSHAARSASPSLQSMKRRLPGLRRGNRAWTDPEHTEKMGRAYAGEVPFSLLPEHTEKLGKAYSGEIQITLTPEHAEAVIRSYLGEIPLSALPEGAYLFEEATGTVWQYSGEIPVSLLPEGLSAFSLRYIGEVQATLHPRAVLFFP